MMNNLTDPKVQAFRILHIGFTVAPIVFGIDKFLNILTKSWEVYLAPIIPRFLNLPSDILMRGIGSIEIMAGIITFFKPQIGAYIVAIWLGAIIINLLLLGRFFDIALRDFGLLLGAIALARLSSQILSVKGKNI